jgi:hypothetical protein
MTYGSSFDALESVPEETRLELDRRIVQDDLVAVELIAPSGETFPVSFSSRFKNHRESPSSNSSIDPEHADQLDQLVVLGDWDAVVTAAQLESEENEKESSRGSSAGSASSVSGSEGGSNGSFGSPLTSFSESVGKSQRLSELREEVVSLVRRVVPEEIDNVDEMIDQFSGREDELVETLRSMQERSIAQKAKAASQRAAKAEARRSVKQAKDTPVAINPFSSPEKFASNDSVSFLTADTSASVSPTDQLSAILVSPSPTSTDKEARRTALIEAVERGDWRAAGETAAMLSDTSTDRDSVDVMSDNDRSFDGLDSKRAAELNQMIAKSDWTGIANLSRRYAEEISPVLSPGSSASLAEAEALQQAELWSKIAEQSRPVGDFPDTGASEATAWAIRRSLAQMKEPLQSRRKFPSSADEEV